MAMWIPPLLRRFVRSERGVALVEFAIVLPLLMLLFAVTIEGGRMMWSYQTVIAGVREATRQVSRMVPTDICPSSLPASGTYNALVARLVRESTSGATVLPAQVRLDPNAPQPVTADFTCVSGSFRLPSTPRVTVSAQVRIDFPFQGIFAFVADGIDPFIVTTISDQSRVFGS